MGRRTPVHVEIYVRDQEQFEKMFDETYKSSNKTNKKSVS